MVASKITDVISADFADNPSSPALGCSSSVPCSICFDLVVDDGERSIAKLQCGHKFHLDCIGSAFNTKGTMQCPNCRKVESGRWLFADGSAHSISETSARDWMPNEGPHDLPYSRRPFGFHWCPFSGFTVHSSIEEAEPSLNTFTNFQVNHAMISEHTASYFRPNEQVANSNLHHPLNSISAPRNNLRANIMQHPSWGWNCHFVPYNADTDIIDRVNWDPHRSPHTQADAIAIPPLFFIHCTIPNRDSVVQGACLWDCHLSQVVLIIMVAVASTYTNQKLLTVIHMKQMFPSYADLSIIIIITLLATGLTGLKKEKGSVSPVNRDSHKPDHYSSHIFLNLLCKKETFHSD